MRPTRWTAAARRVASALLVSLVPLSLSGAAQGAGLYYADRGVRPLGRGGAFIAGADDPGAIAYNPAGLFDAGGQALIDGSWVNFSSDYTRQALVRQVDPNTGETTATYLRTFAPVEGTTPFLPIPTIAVAVRVDPQWVVGGGVWVPYAALTTYPDAAPSGEPAPQRYSLLSLDGSALALIGLGAAYSPIPMLRVGANVGVLTGIFRSTVVFSGCVPERFFCAPEDPDWDVLAELNAGPIVAPTGQVGATLIPHSKIRIGASFQLPIWVRSGATIRNRMPRAAVFATASQEGEDADLGFELPWSARLGVEARPMDNLRVEVSGSYDGWGMHDAINVDPDGIALKNVAGFPERYYIPSIALERGFQDSFSLHLGGEYGFSVAGFGLTARAGVSYDSSAVPRERLSVLTIDGHKITPSVGVSLNVGPFRLDATYARVIMPEVAVAAEEARIQQVSPVQANPPENPTYINGGIYNARANIIGLGATFTFDPVAAAQPSAPAP
ncbi:MAG TPA: outer membrane protein transport protein [Polyangiaceae bacterium]|nr:outer membrane protein transport protein [Polyangiaceae bacterium]